MSTQSWSGVRERVTDLAATYRSKRRFDVRRLLGVAGADRRGFGFGADSHQFLLEDPLTEPELAELEGQLGVRLPEDYRAFLLEVGAGGAGPAYGVFPVRRVAGRWRWEGDGADLAELDRLAEPFPAQGPDPAEVSAFLAVEPQEERFADITDFDQAHEAWEERWQALMWAPERTVGAIVLCHFGCALRAWLVISGPERGTMWADERVDRNDLEPIRGPDGGGLTFAEWYRAWLEDMSSGASGGAPARSAR